MKVLARLRRLRGTAFDPFGRTADRRRERQLIADYESLMDEVLTGLDADSHALAVALASVPEGIRGYGHIKDRHLEIAEAHQKQLLEAFRNPETRKTAAE
jgi:indolepyruvate ferredoxin oxidoreductase